LSLKQWNNAMIGGYTKSLDVAKNVGDEWKQHPCYHGMTNDSIEGIKCYFF
jgi:hypothetical protein